MAQTLTDIQLKTIDGAPASLGDYRGKVLLVVNVASKCGYTEGDYAGVGTLHSCRIMPAAPDNESSVLTCTSAA